MEQQAITNALTYEQLIQLPVGAIYFQVNPYCGCEMSIVEILDPYSLNTEEYKTLKGEHSARCKVTYESGWTHNRRVFASDEVKRHQCAFLNKQDAGHYIEYVMQNDKIQKAVADHKFACMIDNYY